MKEFQRSELKLQCRITDYIKITNHLCKSVQKQHICFVLNNQVQGEESI